MSMTIDRIALKELADKGSDVDLLGNTIADGLRISVPGRNPYPIIEKCVDEIVLVAEEDIVAGMRTLAKDAKLIAEPAASIGIGAMLADSITLKPDAKVCLITPRPTQA
jgi:threonine dehydratase